MHPLGPPKLRPQSSFAAQSQPAPLAMQRSATSQDLPTSPKRTSFAQRQAVVAVPTAQRPPSSPAPVARVRSPVRVQSFAVESSTPPRSALIRSSTHSPSFYLPNTASPSPSLRQTLPSSAVRFAAAPMSPSPATQPAMIPPTFALPPTTAAAASCPFSEAEVVEENVYEFKEMSFASYNVLRQQPDQAQKKLLDKKFQNAVLEFLSQSVSIHTDDVWVEVRPGLMTSISLAYVSVSTPPTVASCVWPIRLRVAVRCGNNNTVDIATREHIRNRLLQMPCSIFLPVAALYDSWFPVLSHDPSGRTLTMRVVDSRAPETLADGFLPLSEEEILRHVLSRPLQQNASQASRAASHSPVRYPALLPPSRGASEVLQLLSHRSQMMQPAPDHHQQPPVHPHPQQHDRNILDQVELQSVGRSSSQGNTPESRPLGGRGIQSPSRHDAATRPAHKARDELPSYSNEVQALRERQQHSQLDGAVRSPLKSFVLPPPQRHLDNLRRSEELCDSPQRHRRSHRRHRHEAEELVVASNNVAVMSPSNDRERRVVRTRGRKHKDAEDLSNEPPVLYVNGSGTQYFVRVSDVQRTSPRRGGRN